MTPEQINIVIAESLGWKNVVLAHPFVLEHPEDFPMVPCGERPEDGRWGPCPRYTTDLNAMHEAVMSLPSGLRDNTFVSALAMVCGFQAHGEHAWDTLHVGRCAVINATAAQRAEAYLKTLNLWED